MKLVLLGLALMSFAAQATSIEQVFGPLGRHDTKACFGKDYTQAHLKKFPKQTVKTIRVLLSVDKTYDSNSLEILVTQKKAPGKNLRQGLDCVQYDGKVHCHVDCDGGSVKIDEFRNDKMLLVNEGLLLKGGCGEEEDESIYLENEKGGDDVFALAKLPLSQCKNVPFPMN